MPEWQALQGTHQLPSAHGYAQRSQGVLALRQSITLRKSTPARQLRWVKNMAKRTAADSPEALSQVGMLRQTRLQGNKKINGQGLVIKNVFCVCVFIKQSSTCQKTRSVFPFQARLPSSRLMNPADCINCLRLLSTLYSSPKEIFFYRVSRPALSRMSQLCSY